jgi:hypothetical protein
MDNTFTSSSKTQTFMKTKTAYWISTGLLSAFMLMTSIPDVIMHPDAIAMIKHLGYPAYFIPFIGAVKISGVIAILTPGFNRLKEWAYAGLVFDLVGAFYSHLSIGDAVSVYIFPLIGLALVSMSYFLFRKRVELKYENVLAASVKSSSEPSHT